MSRVIKTYTGKNTNRQYNVHVPNITNTDPGVVYTGAPRTLTIEGTDFSPHMDFYFFKDGDLTTLQRGTVGQVNQSGTLADITIPAIPLFTCSSITIYLELHPQIADLPEPVYGDIRSDEVVLDVVATGLQLDPISINMADFSEQREDAHYLKKIYLNTPEGTVDDLSTNREHQFHALEQISKFLDRTKNIENETYKDHVSEVYVYDYNDENISSSINTNFYVKKYEDASAFRSLLEMPFYYLENINEAPNYKILSSTTPSDRADFYKNWTFEQKLKNKIFFSTIHEPNETEDFPKSLTLNIELDNTLEAGINKRISFSQDEQIPGKIPSLTYDNLCLKYIKEHTELDAEKIALVSNGEFDTQDAIKYSLDNFTVTNATEEIDCSDITIVSIASQSELSEQRNPDGRIWQREPTRALGFTEKEYFEDAIESIFEHYSTRTYEEILNGQSANTEPFLYELIKYDDNHNKICSYYFPARHYHTEDESRAFKFVDTQIQHGEIYKYRLISHQIIYGESYSFTNNEFDQALYPAEVDIAERYTININKDYIIMPIELAVIEAGTHSSPGLSPEVKIIPQKNKSGMPKFFITSKFGKNLFNNYESKYVPLSDEEDFQSIGHYINSDTGELQVESKYPNKYFEVYRLDKPPTRISDFRDSMIARISPAYYDDVIYSPGATFEDSIDRNRKYYYLFRAVDAFGTPSIPSGPFEYEIIHDGSSMFVNSSSYDMTKATPPSQNMSFRRLLRISPNPKKLQIPVDENTDLTSASTVATSVYNTMSGEINGADFWNKKFKIRIVSKKTGRKIDITFTPTLTRA